LSEVAVRMGLEEKVRIVAQVAEAVHEAHRIGLTHRDLKPANILIEEGDGPERFRPFVVDFGLVHQVDGTALTADGAVLGTPPYMAPEQAEGSSAEVDRRSDVYSLGATLYELLTGRPVFSGSATEMLVQTLQRDPLPPRRLSPHLPADLEVITLKCLEKDPGRRYPSARAVAEDLRRYLDGEPIAARAPSMAYRIRRTVRRHRALALVAGSALVLSATLGIVALDARWEAERRAEVAQRFTGEVKDLEWLMRANAMSPLHDVRPQQAEVRSRMEHLGERAKDLGRSVRGASDYALGRGFLVLGDVPAAQHRLEAAWNGGYHPPEAAFSLGLVYGELYRRELLVARGIGDREARLEAEAVARRTLRDPALELLEAGRGGAGVVPAYLEGLIAFYESRYPASLEASNRALAAAPWLYEAELLRGDALIFAASDDRDAGRYAEAVAGYDRAEEALRRAVDAAPSDPETYQRLGTLAIQRLELAASSRGGDVEEIAGAALATCRRGLEADPDHAGLHLEVASLWAGLAALRSAAGDQRPEPAWEEAADHAARAAELDPGNQEVWQVWATIYSDRARYRAEHGEDPRDDYDLALEAARRGAEVALDPVRLLNLQGIIAIRRANYESSTGEDPAPSLAAAVSALDRAVALDPEYGYAFNNLGRAYSVEARHRAKNGLDARPSLLKSADALRRAVAINPENAVAWNNLGVTLSDRGLETLERGEDPRTDLDEADRSFRRTQEINPEYGPAFNNLALTAIYQARYLVSRGQDPAAVLAPAGPALAEVVRLVPRAYQPHMNLARVEMVLASYQRLAGGDPRPELERAREHYRHALELNPRQPGAHAELAGVEILAARHALDRGQGSAREALADAAEHVDMALAVAPNQAAGLTARAEIAVLSARLEPSQAASSWSVAETAVAQALEQNPKDADAARVAAELALDRARPARAETRRQLLRQGLERLAPALDLNPEDATLLALRGRLRRALSEEGDETDLARSAETDLRRAVEINPLLGPRLAPLLEGSPRTTDPDPAKRAT
ncbi:MAG: tetratricopeptide repeat protein, partial [Acidobacteria bacterium]|nr:tetratricopeptide repeat protein [Acidobacteriota bacterium]